MASNGTFSGYLGKDPEIREAGSSQVAKFSLAESHKKDTTNWFDVEVWGKQADWVIERLSKGSWVSVTGAIRIDKWEGNSGPGTTVVIEVNSFNGIDFGPKQAGAERAPAREAVGYDQDVPF